MYINEVRAGSEVTLDGTYRNNQHNFQHGLGGAACIEYLEGVVNLNGNFVQNKAADGAGVHLDNIAEQGTLNINGVFRGNHAIDYGLGCRGAAVRPWFVYGTINVDGVFDSNIADGRGAVFATNRCVFETCTV